MSETETQVEPKDTLGDILKKQFENMHKFELESAKASQSRWQRLKSIFEGVTIYLHVLSTKESKPESQFPHLEVAASSVPFFEKGWEETVHRFGCTLNHLGSDFAEESEGTAPYRHLYACLDICNLAEVLTAQGHEVYVCFSKNPGGKIGSYSHFSKNKLADMVKIDEWLASKTNVSVEKE